MASYIKTLKEDNGDITYPQTLASAVFIGNSDVETEMGKYVTAEDIASTSALTPPVTTNMIANDAVTTAKIDDEAVTPGKLSFGKYSTTKQQIGIWIDDRPVYRIVVTGTTSAAVNEVVEVAGLRIDVLLMTSGCILRGDGRIDPVQRICPDANIQNYSLGLGDFTTSSTGCTFLFQHPNSTYQSRTYHIVIEYVEPAS